MRMHLKRIYTYYTKRFNIDLYVHKSYFYKITY